MKTFVLTVATDRRKVHPRFAETVGKYGIDVNYVGEGGGFTGWGWRLKRTWEILGNLSGKATHILFVDSYDLAFAAGLGEIEERYREFGHPWVFGAERVCSPFSELAPLAAASPTPYRYLNAGVWMGELDYVYGWFGKMGLGNVHDEFHDQGFFSMLSLAYPAAIRLDHQQKLFFNACKADSDFMIKGPAKRVQVRSTGSYPSILHANGRFDLEKLFVRRGLGMVGR